MTRWTRPAVSILTRALVCMAALVGASCADAGDAPLSVSAETCPDLDDYLAPLIELSEAQALVHLPGAIAEDLNADERRDTLALFVTLAEALEGITGAADDTEVRGPASSWRLGADLAALLEWLSVSGPEAPYLTLFEALARGLESEVCQGDDALELAATLLGEPAFIQALWELHTHPELGSRELVLALESPPEDPRAGLRSVLRSLLESASEPDFRIEVWVGLLGLVLDTREGSGLTLSTELERLFQPGAALDALRGTVTCVLAADPELQISDLIYDALVHSPVGEDELGREALESLFADAKVRPALAALSEALALDERSRRALSRFVSALIAPERRLGVLSELQVLLEGGMFEGLWGSVQALAGGPC